MEDQTGDALGCSITLSKRGTLKKYPIQVPYYAYIIQEGVICFGHGLHQYQ